jgi:hypothetical protein
MSDNKAVRRFFGYILMGVGGLITLLGGGCTVVWLGFLAWSIIGGLNGTNLNPINLNSIGNVAGLTLAVGGLPIAIGVALVIVGLRLAEDE